MNFGSSRKSAVNYLNMLNLFLLVSHAGLLILFAVIEVYLMAFVNIGSVLYYVSGFYLLKQQKTAVYIRTTFCEILIHMFLAVVSTGWNMGFQLHFIGCMAIVFYVDYFSARLGQSHIKGVSYCIASAVLYLISFLITRFAGCLYDVVETMKIVGMVLNSVAVFAFVTVLFGLLTRMAAYYEQELGRQATHDKLTGMVNRHYLVDQLDAINAERKMTSYWIAILDIDDFKKINDRYGHLCGDFVLRSLAEIIKKNCGDRTVCRWGGEEFVIVGDDSGRDETGRRQESVLLDHIRRDVAIRDFVYDANTTVNMTVTIGTARYREGQTVDEWINMADARLYRGKKSGKNKVVDSD